MFVFLFLLTIVVFILGCYRRDQAFLYGFASILLLAIVWFMHHATTTLNLSF